MSANFSAILYLLIIPSFTMLWTSRNIAVSLKNNEYVENKSTIATIGYNEPSLVFEVGTNIKVFKNINKFLENFSLFDYLIIEKDYYIEFNKQIKEASLVHKKISSLIGKDLSNSLPIKRVPELRFIYDDHLDNVRKIDSIIDEID